MLAAITGILIAVGIYLLVFSPPAEDGQQKDKKAESDSNTMPEYDTIGNPVRFCPVCRRRLDPGEKILGIVLKAQPKDKILVKGCRTCNALPAAHPENQSSG